MARRKQQNPRHLETSNDLAASLQNGISPSSDSEDDEHVCGKCRAEFPSLSDFLKHKQACVSKRPVLLLDGSHDDPDDDDNDSCLSPPRLTAAMDPPTSLQNGLNLFAKDYSPKVSDISQLVQRLSDTNVTLEELRNTTVAVAQHGRLLQETHLAALLSNIHQQQVAQLHVIQELQAQITGAQDASNKGIPLVGTAALTPPQSGSDSAMGVAPPSSGLPSAPTSARTSTISKSLQSCEGQAGIPMYEPNTLELLQRHTEQALQNTMSGGSFLLNTVGNASEMAKLRRTKDGKVDEVAARHRCKFCGKIFGSDSSLQIHIRSHTGERPFKCNVCSSSFSTKGNLKVHFQRHKERLELSAEHHTNENQSSSLGLDKTLSVTDQALDFSTSLNGKTTPSNEQPAGCTSRSDTPNEVSNLSDDSVDPSDIGVENLRNQLVAEGYRFEDEDDDDDDDRASNSSIMNYEDDLDPINPQQIDSHRTTFSSPTFTPFFRPISFGATMPSGSPSCLPSPIVPPSSIQSNQDTHLHHHQNPQAYQDLLPRIGSNDNSWESLMEVTETSETSKLQKLVDKIEVLDPNQCAFCHRVLSCKSALQMHYRTHTGERPFRCKICGRAFTTKGNLKTHMSVHRHKPPSRILHQCPVCHKQLANAVLLQQHVRMHTGSGVIHLQDPFFYGDEESPTLLPPSYPRPMMIPAHMVIHSEPLALTNNHSRRQAEDEEQLKTKDSVIKTTQAEHNLPGVTSPSANSISPQSSPRTPNNAESLANGETKAFQVQKSEEMSDDVEPKISYSSPVNTPNSKPSTPPTTTTKESGNSTKLTCDAQHNINDFHKSTNDSQIEKLTEKSMEESRKANVIQHHPTVSIANDKPLPMTLPSDCPIPLNLNNSERHMMPMSIPNTTSYTASLAALENHVKAINSTTTNPLPFPPTLGMGFPMPNYYRTDYGLPTYHSKDKIQDFSPNGRNHSDISTDERSTPGSIVKDDSPKSIGPARSESGALDLTPRGSSSSSSTTPQHLPSDLKMFTPLSGLPFPSPHLARFGTTCQICFKTFACQSALEIHYRSHTKERPFKCEVCDRGFSTKGNMKQHMLTHKIRDLPAKLFTSSLPPTPHQQSSTVSPTSPSTSLAMITVESPMVLSASCLPKPKFDEMPMRRPSSEGGHPTPKRSPSTPKHVCEVCHKPFSSGSALQIHMRTHTGVKPFQCNICSRAFTTKGNLKVHMGTHLSNNGASRRGRRMSLDISPLSLSMAAKPGEYPPPRHDLFFPYLPPFMNGMSRPLPPPKMNEISVIQSAIGRDGGEPSTSRPMTMPPPSVSLALLGASTRPLSLMTTTASESKANVQTPRDGDSLEKSSARRRELFSPMLRGPETVQMAERNASWCWKIACNHCNKICSSSLELENHIKKEHAEAEAKDSHDAMDNETHD